MPESYRNTTPIRYLRAISNSNDAEERSAPDRRIRSASISSFTVTSRNQDNVSVIERIDELQESAERELSPVDDDDRFNPERSSSPMTPGKILYQAARNVLEEESTLKVDYGTDEHDNIITDDGGVEREEADADGEAPYDSRTIRQKEQSDKETLVPHPTDPNVVLAAYSYEHNGTTHVQVDEIPDIPLVLVEGQTLAQEIWPEPKACKVPSKRRAKKGVPTALWIRDDVKDCWTRTLVSKGQMEVQMFRVQVVFRRCHPETFKYTSMYANPKKLENADPNDKDWMYGYNKWIDQIRRRNTTDFTPEVAREHWTATELRAMLTGINAHCHTNGIDRFGTKGAPMSDADFQVIADGVNAVAVPGRRNVDAVRSQVNSAHSGKLPMLLKLRELAEEMRLYLEAGQPDGAMSDAERRPLHAIPLSEFPADPAPGGRKRGTPGRDKGKGKFLTRGSSTGSGENSDGDADPVPSVSKLAIPGKRKRKSPIAASDEAHSDDSEEAFEALPAKRVRTTEAGPSSRPI